MSKKVCDEIAEGLNETLAFARGKTAGVKVYIPAEIDVRAIRTKLGLSQNDFASAYGFTLRQIRHWEQGRFRPVHANRAYLMIIDRHPAQVLEWLRAAGRRSARLSRGH
jgi:putative transcriptional regulator